MTSTRTFVGSSRVHASIHYEGLVREFNDWARPGLNEEQGPLLARRTTKTQNLRRNTTYANERQEGHGQLHRSSAFEIAWHLHGEVLLWLVVPREERRELGVEGAHVEEVPENF
jgi:hypothetical protein